MSESKSFLNVTWIQTDETVKDRLEQHHEDNEDIGNGVIRLMLMRMVVMVGGDDDSTFVIFLFFFLLIFFSILYHRRHSFFGLLGFFITLHLSAKITSNN